MERTNRSQWALRCGLRGGKRTDSTLLVAEEESLEGVGQLPSTLQDTPNLRNFNAVESANLFNHTGLGGKPHDPRRIEEARIAEFGSILCEFDVDPGDNIAKWASMKGPSCPILGLKVLIHHVIESFSPLPLESVEPGPYTTSRARPEHVVA